MVKIAHEAPLAAYEFVKQVTDYDYFLVHLFMENEAYLEKFNNRTRKCILDNSIFELGHAWPRREFLKWVVKLRSGDEYIIPDVLQDTDGTIDSANKWFEMIHESSALRGTNIRSIGVVQGRTYEDIIRCYQYMNTRVDKIAISFDYDLYLDMTKDHGHANKWEQYMYGRRILLSRLDADGVINRKKPHHLLGCSLPQEGTSYWDMPWIDSVDTSSPVVHGLEGITYNGIEGLEEKHPIKLIEYMNKPVTVDQFNDIAYNTSMFRAIWSGAVERD